MSDKDELFGNAVIFSYSRAEAIRDGVLVDVTTTAKEAGFKHNVAVSSAVWSMIQPSEEVQKRFGCDVDGRLWEVLWMAIFAIKSQRANEANEILYDLILPQSPRNPGELVKLKMHCGPGDNAEPVITIMLPGED